MKLCPRCEFVYEDDQSLCDMDGQELVYKAGLLAFEQNPPPAPVQLQRSATTPVSLAPGLVPGLIPSPTQVVPSGSRSTSYAFVVVLGILLATLLFLVYQAKTHTSESVDANKSPEQSSELATYVSISAPAATADLVSPSVPPAENAATDQLPEQLISPNSTPMAQSTSPPLAATSEKSSTRARPSPGPVSAASASRRGPVLIRLTSGESLKAEDAWETRDGIWYRQGGMVALLKRRQVRAIERRPPSQKSGEPETRLNQNQRRPGSSEVTMVKKESRVTSFLKKTGSILRRPFKL